MQAFAPTQAYFAQALLDADSPLPASVTSYTTRTPQKRFAVYRNNVVAGLVAALRTQFPAAERIVGEEFFAAMAHAYIVTTPPNSPLLVLYGEAFPEFIARFAPAEDIPYLADVARLEVARTRAYHAADAMPLDPAVWQALEPAALPNMRVTLHPSVQVLRSEFPVVTIWSMNTGDGEPAPVEDWSGEDAVIARPQFDVEVRRLPPGGAAFLSALAQGLTLGEAAMTAAAENGAFDLAANLAGLIGAGLATALQDTTIQKAPAP